MKRSKLILIFLLLVLFVPNNIYGAEIVRDIGGSQSGSGGGGGGSCSGSRCMNMIAGVRVMLVKANEDSVEYYSEAYYTKNLYDEFYSNPYICGYVNGTYYSGDCGWTSRDDIIYTDYSFWYNYYNGWPYVYVDGIIDYFNSDYYFKQTVNALTLRAYKNDKLSKSYYDLDNLSSTDKKELKRLLILIEPVYKFAKSTSSYIYDSIFATAKGIAKINGEYGPFGLSKWWYLPYYIYSSNSYGLINYYGATESNWSSITSGLGWGVFTVLDSFKTCDPNTECCYDENKEYHDEYEGTEAENYTCKFDEDGNCVKIASCAVTTCNDANKTTNNLDVSCNNGKIENQETELNRNICVDLSVTGDEQCSVELAKDGKTTLVANVTFKQKISELAYTLSPDTIFYGGGFGLSMRYLNSSYWIFNSNSTENKNMDTCPLLAVWRYDSSTDSCVLKAEYDDTCNTDNFDTPLDVITNRVTNYYKSEYNNLKNNGYNMSMPNSNDTDTNGNNNNTGSWTCTSDLENTWNQNNQVLTSCNFELYDAYIDRKTGKVIYGNYSKEDYLSEGKKYFTPINRTFKNNLFNIKTTSDEGYNISVVNGMDINLKSSCSVNLYKGNIDKENYYYRPIDLTNIFPNGRNPGVNWYDWYTNNKDNLTKRLNNTYNNLEYEAILEWTIIDNLKAYNKTHNYFDLDETIDNYGYSDIIKNSNYGISTKESTHSKLGECNSTTDCIEGGNS